MRYEKQRKAMKLAHKIYDEYAEKNIKTTWSKALKKAWSIIKKHDLIQQKSCELDQERHAKNIINFLDSIMKSISQELKINTGE